MLNFSTCNFFQITIVVPLNFLDTLPLLPSPRYDFYLHENSQRHFFFGKRKGGDRISSRSRLLLHLLPCQPCPATSGSQMQSSSLGTVCVPGVQGASAPFEAEIYCSESGLWYNHDESPGTMIGELLI